MMVNTEFSFMDGCIDEYLAGRGVMVVEGHSGQVARQTDDLAKIASSPGVARILEIGFNAGHSADTMLSSGDATVVSFDIGEHECVRVAKEYIDGRYPGRHALIIGDSRLTIPEYAASHPGETFDVIYIDGGHDYDVALSDLTACRSMSHSGTVVVMDDVVRDLSHNCGYNIGPTTAWAHMVDRGDVAETSYAFYGPGRGQVVGKYTAMS